MRVALVNNNPAVSRLTTMSLSKIGCQYTEVDSLDLIYGDFFDVLILDSGVEIGNQNLKALANKILYLATKNSPEINGVDRVLFKPFLPTEFVAVMSKFDLAKDENIKEQDVNLQSESELGSEEMKFMDSLDDIDLSSNLDENLNNLEFADMDGLNLAAEEDLDEDKLAEDIMLKQLMEDEVAEEKAGLSVEFEDFGDKDLSLDKETLAMAEEIEEVELDLGIVEEEFEPSSPSVYDEQIEFCDDFDMQQDEFSAESFDIPMDEIKPKESDLDVINSIKLDIDEIEDLDLNAKNLDSAEFDFSDISEISELDMKLALNEKEAFSDMKFQDNGLKTEPKTDEAEAIKSEISTLISEQITASLNQSSIKEALKNMNIKINITFEEK